MEMLDDFTPGEVGLIFVLFVSRFFFFLDLSSQEIWKVEIIRSRNIFKYERLTICA